MVIQRTINNLKERPHHERRAVALIVASLITLIVFIAWIYTFFSGVRASANAQLEAQAQQQQAAQ